MPITIHESQINDFASLRFESRLIQAISEDDPSAASELSSQAGRDELRRQCAKARSYGLVEEVDIARYVVTAWLMGVDFDTRFPAMHQVLTHDTMLPGQKADAIEKISLTVLKQLEEGGN